MNKLKLLKEIKKQLMKNQKLKKKRFNLRKFQWKQETPLR